MHNIIIEKPYQFVPPHHGWFWPPIIHALLPQYLRKYAGLEKIEHRGVERIEASLRAGHGILLTPNHCRPDDAFVVGTLARRLRQSFFTVASWHLFNVSAFQSWALRRCGAFSIYREGMDRAAVNTSIDILTAASRPLVIFPEGLVSRTNDLLGGLMEGTALIARTAAKRRAKPEGSTKDGKVVVHPVAIRYFFEGDLLQTIEPVLTEIERRLTFKPRTGAGPEFLYERIHRIGAALLALKEIDILGKAGDGPIGDRLVNLIDQILAPLEREWLNGEREPHTAARVKRLRQAILPDMVKGDIEPGERERRWRQLESLYLAQQLANYPPDYVKSRPLKERVLETVERFEEDLTDNARIHRPFRCVVQVGDAIEVSPERERGKGGDPLMQKVEESLRLMLSELARESGPELTAPSNARGDGVARERVTTPGGAGVA